MQDHVASREGLGHCVDGIPQVCVALLLVDQGLDRQFDPARFGVTEDQRVQLAGGQRDVGADHD